MELCGEFLLGMGISVESFPLGRLERGVGCTWWLPAGSCCGFFSQQDAHRLCQAGTICLAPPSSAVCLIVHDVDST